VVFTHSPVDYMADHEITSRLCQTACFGAMAPNFRTGRRKPAKPLSEIPCLYYADAFGRRDILGHTIPSAIYVDIAETLVRKKEMLACHKSQQTWLASQQQISEPESLMLKMAEETGQCAGARWAEGFRQHLGQGFPQDNLLGRLLREQVRF
jgi:LmbE family N-acetylglucosaminyl deacetylase